MAEMGPITPRKIGCVVVVFICAVFYPSVGWAVDSTPISKPLEIGSQVRVRLAEGQQFRARLASTESLRLHLVTDQGQLSLPWTRIASIEPVLEMATTTSALGGTEVGTNSTISSLSAGLSKHIEVHELTDRGQPGKAAQLLTEEIAAGSQAMAWHLVSQIVQRISNPLSNTRSPTTDSLGLESERLVSAIEVFAHRVDADQFSSTCLLAGHWLSTHRQVEALERLARILDPLRPDDAAKLHHLIEYQRRLDQVPANDYLSMYRLAKWALERGLLDEARVLLEVASHHPDLGPNARLHLEILRRKSALAVLEKIRSAASGGSQSELNSAMAEFKRLHSDSPYVGHAWALSEVQRVSQQRKHNQRRLDGQAALQDLERLARMGDYPGVIVAAQRILSNQPEPEIAFTAKQWESLARQTMGGRQFNGPTGRSDAGSSSRPTQDTLHGSLANPVHIPASISPEQRRLIEIDALAREAARKANRPPE